MLTEKIATQNCCIVCRNLNNDTNNYEHLFVSFENDSKRSIQLTNTGYLYEDLFGLKIPLDSREHYPQFLCPICGLQMKLFKNFKAKALETWETLRKVFYNVKVKSLAASGPEPIKADFTTDDLIQYEELEFINDEYSANDNDNIQSDDVNSYNKIIESTKFDKFNANSQEQNKSIEQNNLTTPPIISDTMITKEDINYITLELTEDIDENDYITEIYEIPQDYDVGYDDCLNDAVVNAKQMGQEKELRNICNKYSHQPKRSLRKSLGKKNLKCELCRVDFDSFKDMKAHGNDVHNGKYPCGQCLKLFTSIESLRVHANLHKGTLQYHCDLCSRAFNQKVHYQTHMRQHQNDRNFQCTACENAFFTKADLKIHERKHTGQRPHVCDICGKDFILAIHLKMHQYSHTKEKKFSCDYCKRLFVTPNTLRLHKQTIHVQERQFHCEYCTKSFRRKHHLMYHIKNIHQNG